MAAYKMAAEHSGANFSEFAEESKFFDFAVTSLGARLSLDVECNTGLPVSTPAELREKKFQQRIARSQEKANKIADKQRRIQEALAKKMTLKMKREQRGRV